MDNKNIAVTEIDLLNIDVLWLQIVAINYLHSVI